MKLKIVKSIASPSYSYSAGQEVEISQKRIEEFIRFGIAVPVETQTEAKQTKETTAKRKGRKKNADDS